MQGVIIFSSQCKTAQFFTWLFCFSWISPVICYDLCLLWSFSMKTQRCVNPRRHWGHRQSRRWVKKAQQFLVEAQQNDTVSKRKKVTEENKTAELPGSRLPTHTLTYKCRYATYSRRFTESNPPTYTQTCTHTLPLSCPSRFLTLSHTDVLSGNPEQSS